VFFDLPKEAERVDSLPDPFLSPALDILDSERVKVSPALLELKPFADGRDQGRVASGEID
jgi:hypothetical protein